MKKVAIRFSFDEHTEYDEIKPIAQDLQRFIVEGDYKLSSIVKQIREHERIELDVGMEENMPEFTQVVSNFDEEEIEYELYKPLNGDWDKCELDDLKLDRTPKWILFLIGLNVIWYLTMTLMQFFVIYDFYSEQYAWSGIASALGALGTTLVPIVGSWVAYWNATVFWDWNGLETFLAFFGYYLPIVGFFLYLVWLIIKVLYRDRWYRFWRPEFN